jgi:hypothetical protein
MTMAQKVNIIQISSDIFHIFSVNLGEKEWIATLGYKLAMTAVCVTIQKLVKLPYQI